MKELILKKSKIDLKNNILYLIGSIALLIVIIILIMNSGGDISKYNFKSYRLGTLNFVWIFGLLSILGIFAGIGGIIDNRKKLKEFFLDVSEENMRLAYDEMLDSSTVSYYNAGIYLTKHYLICLAVDKYCIVPYEDIIWLYTIRTIEESGTFKKTRSKVGDCIKVHTNLGKIYNIGGNSLANDDYAYVTIYNRCYQANPHIIMNYSKENKKAYKIMQDKIKQIRQAGDDPRIVLRPSDIEHTPL